MGEPASVNNDEHRELIKDLVYEIVNRVIPVGGIEPVTYGDGRSPAATDQPEPAPDHYSQPGSDLETLIAAAEVVLADSPESVPSGQEKSQSQERPADSVESNEIEAANFATKPANGEHNRAIGEDSHSQTPDIFVDDEVVTEADEVTAAENEEAVEDIEAIQEYLGGSSNYQEPKMSRTAKRRLKRRQMRANLKEDKSLAKMTGSRLSMKDQKDDEPDETGSDNSNVPSKRSTGKRKSGPAEACPWENGKIKDSNQSKEAEPTDSPRMSRNARRKEKQKRLRVAQAEKKLSERENAAANNIENEISKQPSDSESPAVNMTQSNECKKSNQNKHVKKSSGSSKSSSGNKPKIISAKQVANWKKVLRLPTSMDDRLTSSQIFKPVAPSYGPCVPPGTSKRLIEHLTPRDLEQLACPGCKDRFLLPESFFQHIYRKSMAIDFSCEGCHQSLRFNNPCHLKIHVLSHLEIDNVASVSSSYTNVSPAQPEDLNVRFKSIESMTEDLDRVHKDQLSFDPSRRQCMECKLSLDQGKLASHYSRFSRSKKPFQCQMCPAVLPNSCCLSAHVRIHNKEMPFVCPDCGEKFETWSYFQSHVQRSCHHEQKVLSLSCKLCENKGQPPVIESANLISHMLEEHVKLLYKCTGCSKAFDEKSAIYEHRSEMHKDADENQADFYLLYKAKFLKAPRNLFNSRKAFEERMSVLTKSWVRYWILKCPSCSTLFESPGEFESHNQRWCEMQNSSGGASKPKHSKLFPPKSQARTIDKEKALEEKLSLINDFCPKGCSECQEHLTNLRLHFSKHADNETDTTEGRDDDDEEVPVKQAKLTRSRLSAINSNGTVAKVVTASADYVPASSLKQSVSNVSSESQNDSCLKPVVMPSAIKIAKVDFKEDIRTPSPSGRGSSKKVKRKLEKGQPKPFVETLGKDVPSDTRLLALNNLPREALTLGSSVSKACPVKMNKEKVYQCKLCDFWETDRQSFQTHILIHRSGKSDDYHFMQCKECGMMFASTQTWKTHLLISHRIKRPQPEDYCMDLNVPSPPKRPHLQVIIFRK